MAEVPYQPYPDVAPPERILRPGGVPEVPDAFGVGVANAVHTFGGKVETAGGEVFDKALALRKLDLDNKVRDQITSTYTGFAPTREKFMSATGINASVDKLQEFHGQLDDAYQAGLAQARALGPYAEKRYGDEAASWYRQVSNAATEHSANETKQATKLSIKNSDAMSSDLVSSAPGNERVYQEQVIARLDRAEREGALEGRTRDEIEFNKKNAVSSLAWDRINGAAQADKNGTGAAYDLLQRLQQEKVPGQDYPHLSIQKDIQDAEKIVRTRFFAGSDAAIKSKEEDLVDEVRAVGRDDSPKAQRLRTEIQGLRDRRVKLGETQETADLAGKELDVKVGAAAASYKVDLELRGSSPYQPLIDANAAKYGQNPLWLGRLLHQESGLNPNVRDSPAGAQGIAQFMPETARRYGVDVRSVPSSVEGAAHYLSDLMKMPGINGNVGLALAAYNWGEHRVIPWVQGGANPSAMPLETRNYVKAITGQSISDWVAGKEPDVTALKAPQGAAGAVQRAALLVDQMATDRSVPSSQRDANVAAGNKVVDEFVKNNIRRANMTDVKQKQVDDTFLSDVIKDSIREQPQYTEQMIKNMPDETEGGPSAGAKLSAIRYLGREGLPGPSEADSHRNVLELLKRVNAPEGDPQKITNRKTLIDAAGVTISKGDYDWIEKKFDDLRTPGGERFSKLRGEFSKTANKYLDTSNLIKVDQEGALRAYNFERFTDSVIDQWRAAGKDPTELLVPGPHYLGNKEILEGFDASAQEQVENINRRLNPKATPAPGPPQPGQVGQPRRPGESPGDYLKRVGVAP